MFNWVPNTSLLTSIFSLGKRSELKNKQSSDILKLKKFEKFEKFSNSNKLKKFSDSKKSGAGLDDTLH